MIGVEGYGSGAADSRKRCCAVRHPFVFLLLTAYCSLPTAFFADCARPARRRGLRRRAVRLDARPNGGKNRLAN